MATVPCPQCEQPINAVAVVCPHCNARRTDVDPHTTELSNAEVQALLLMHSKDAPASQGLLSALVLPHPQTHGTARTVEIALTIVTLPLVMAGALSYLMSRARVARRDAAETSGELTPALAIAALGGVSLALTLAEAGLGGGLVALITGAEITAVFTRAAIRARAANRRRRELHRLPGPNDAEPTGAPIKMTRPAARMPVARALRMPALPAKQVTAPTAAAASEPAPPPADQPRLLK